MRKGYSKDFYLINNILKEWDPIEVGEKAAEDEYLKVIPALIRNIGNFQKIIETLEDYLLNDLGLDYDSKNIQHKNEIISIAQKINRVSLKNE